MKQIAAFLVVVLVAVTAVFATNNAQAQDDGITLTLLKAVGGADPEPAGTDFEFIAPVFGSDIVIKPGGGIQIPAAGTVSFTMTQIQQEGWQFVSATCEGTTDFTVFGADRSLSGTAQGEDVTCTFTSTPIDPDPVTLTVSKVVQGSDPEGTAFEFTNDANDATNTLLDGESFSLTFTPPSITITETPQIGWNVADFACTGAFEIFSSELLQVHTIRASPGSDVACTFTNEPVPVAELTVTKRVVGENPDDPAFAFTLDTDLAVFDLSEDEAVQVLLNPGVYTLAETPLAGWQTPTFVCNDGELIQADEIEITLAAGSTSCVVQNELATESLIGDVTCNGRVNILDAYATSQYVVNIREGVRGCPLPSPSTQINLDAVSVDGERVTIQDAYRIAQCVVDIPNEFCPEPPE